MSVCGAKPCVVVVTGSVIGCGRRNPEPRNRSYKGPRQLSQSCACKKGGKGGARISTWTGGHCPGEENSLTRGHRGWPRTEEAVRAERENGTCCVCSMNVCSKGGVGRGGR